jgi:pyruvate dehydrogenase E1 component
MASTIPNCVVYDPTYAYELAVIIQHGLVRMIQNEESVFYYITVMNENYVHPDMPKGCEEGILKGMYLLHESASKHKLRVQLMGSGTILREVIEAAKWLENVHDVAADIWSVTSFNELRREGLMVERENRMNPGKKAKLSYVTQQLAERQGPVIVATDYMRLYAEQIRQFVPGPYVTLGTDGFGRSDTRQQLRHFFEVDAKFIVIATLNALADKGEIPKSKVADAMKHYNIDSKKLDPVTH